MAIEELDRLCTEKWGAPVRSTDQFSDRKLPRLRDLVRFEDLTPELKIHVADKIIRESVPRSGAMTGNGDPRWFLGCCAADLPFRRGIFDDRRMEVMQAAFVILAKAMFFSSSMVDSGAWGLDVVFGRGGIGLTANYLLAQLEYTFRCKGPYLDAEGLIINRPPASFQPSKLFEVGKRINRIEVAFDLYLDGCKDAFAQRIAALNQIAGVRNRLETLRNAAAHGELPDLSGEAHFYGLLLAMFFYNEPA